MISSGRGKTCHSAVHAGHTNPSFLRLTFAERDSCANSPEFWVRTVSRRVGMGERGNPGVTETYAIFLPPTTTYTTHALPTKQITDISELTDNHLPSPKTQPHPTNINQIYSVRLRRPRTTLHNTYFNKTSSPCALEFE